MRDATILRKPRNLVLLRDEYVEWSHRFSHWYDSRGLLAPTICKYLGEGCGKWVSQMECFHQVHLKTQPGLPEQHTCCVKRSRLFMATKNSPSPGNVAEAPTYRMVSRW